MQNIFSKLKIYLLIIVLATLFLIPYLGSVHLFDSDEIYFAEISREMIETKDYLKARIDYEPLYEKPPLFFWFQVLSMKIFGVNEFAARFPNATIGIASLLIIFSIGKKLFDEKFGLLWVLAYLGSLLPHFYFKTGIIDPLFNLFVFLGVYFLFRFSYNRFYNKNIEEAERPKHFKYILLASLFVSLSVLTKGPVGYFLAASVWICYEFFNKNIEKFPLISFLQFTLLTAIIPIVWHLIVFLENGQAMLQSFILYHIKLLAKGETGGGGPIYFHFIVLLIGCFPASVIMLRGFRAYIQNSMEQNSFRLLMLITLGVVLVIFSLASTKSVHYSTLAYFPISFLGTLAVYNITYKELVWKKSTLYLLSCLGFLWVLALSLTPILLINAKAILPYISGEQTKEILKAKTNWLGSEWFIGILYLAGLILSIYLLAKKKYIEGFISVFSSTALVLLIALPLLAPNIEKQIQGASIEFYKEQVNKDSYVYTLGFESYANFFYSKKPYYLSPRKKNVSKEVFENWLLTGSIDKAAFFVCKIDNFREYIEEYDLTFLYSKGGFVFLKREPS